MNVRRNPNFANYEGPTYRAGRDVPCHACDASGVITDGERIDVDAYRDCLCGNCDGSGIEPWRAAGDRDTSNPSRDALSHSRAPAWTEDAARRNRSLKPAFEFLIFDLRAQRILAQRRCREYEAAMLSAADQCAATSQSAVAAWRQAVAA